MEQEQKKTSRRKFVKDAGSLLGGVTVGSMLGLGGSAGAEAPDEAAMPTAVLGRTGVTVSRLGLGCGHFQQKRLTANDVGAVLARAVELGITYIDTAPNYGAQDVGYSEVKMGPTTKAIRDKIFLVSKTEEPTYDGTWRLLKQSLKRLQTDHLDLVHLHNVGMTTRFPDFKLALGNKGALGALREAKKQGVIRFIGASGHLYPSRFHAVLDTGDIDVVMCATNFVTQHTYDFEHKVFARAGEKGLGLVGMKVLGGQTRTRESFRIPTEFYESAIRYALSIPKLVCAVIGMWKVAQVDKAAETVKRFKPLSGDEWLALSKQGLALAGTSPWKTIYGKPLT